MIPAVKPQDVVNKLVLKDEHILLINSELSKPWSSYDQTNGRIIGRPRLDQVIIEQLIQYFRAAGWDVKYEADQRDGDFLRFKPRSASTWQPCQD